MTWATTSSPSARSGRATDPPVEIDAVVLAGRRREATLVGEATWARRVDGARIRAELERKAAALPRVGRQLRYAVCALKDVTAPDNVLAVTAEQIFAPSGVMDPLPKVDAAETPASES